MKKSKIFMAAGGLVLAITAVFAVKANKKFTAFTTGYAAGNVIVKASSNVFTTTHGGNLVSAIITVSGTPGAAHVALYTKANGTGHILYVAP